MHDQKSLERWWDFKFHIRWNKENLRGLASKLDRNDPKGHQGDYRPAAYIDVGIDAEKPQDLLLALFLCALAKHRHLRYLLRADGLIPMRDRLLKVLPVLQDVSKEYARPYEDWIFRGVWPDFLVPMVCQLGDAALRQANELYGAQYALIRLHAPKPPFASNDLGVLISRLRENVADHGLVIYGSHMEEDGVLHPAVLAAALQRAAAHGIPTWFDKWGQFIPDGHCQEELRMSGPALYLEPDGKVLNAPRSRESLVGRLCPDFCSSPVIRMFEKKTYLALPWKNRNVHI